MDRQPGPDHGEGDQPGREPGCPGAPGPAPVPDPRLAGFAAGGLWDACPPSGALAAAAEAVAGPQWRCPGATGNQLTGVLRRLAALEAWASAGRLGVIREMIRRECPPQDGGNRHGDLPDTWPQSLGYEVAAALGVSVQSADAAALLAWDLQARLPGIGGRLADGTLSYVKVMLIVRELSILTEDDAAKAEALILDQLARTPGLTPAQLARLAAQAAVTVDPDGARRRREAAEQLDVRVRLWREQSGAAAIAGRNLPTDEALAAYASVNARTAQYKKSKAFPGASTDQLRAMAYLDLLNGITADDRIASARAKAAADAQAPGTQADNPAPARPDPARPDPARPDPAQPGQDRPPAAGGCPFGGDCGACDGRCLPDDSDSPQDKDQDDGDTGAGGPGCACRECDGSCVPLPDENDYDDEESPYHGHGGPDDGGPEGSGPDDGNPPGGPDDGPRSGPPPRSPSEHPEPPSLTDLVVPLLTLLGLAGRPGEGHGLGPLDPALCRDLAAAAANSLRSQWCVTLTDPDGFAIGHGCARLRQGDKATWKTWLSQPHIQRDRLAALPSQVNLTLPAAALPALAGLARPGSPPGRDSPANRMQPTAGWAFTPHDSTAMPETGTPHAADALSGTSFLAGADGPPGTDGPPTAGGQPGAPADGNGYGTWTLTLPGSAMAPAPSRPAPAMPKKPTSNTPLLTTRAEGRARAMPVPEVENVIG